VSISLDSTQIYTEAEWNGLLLKRKIDPVWKEIAYLQSYSRVKVNKILFILQESNAFIHLEKFTSYMKRIKRISFLKELFQK